MTDATVHYALIIEPCDHVWGEWEVVDGSVSEDGESVDLYRECEKCGATETEEGAYNWSETIK